MKTIFTAIVIFAASVFAAEDPKTSDQPKSQAAVSAIAEYAKAADLADAACRAAKLKADRTLISKLKIALIASTKSGNLDDANAISAELKSAVGRLDEFSSTQPAKPKYSNLASAKFSYWEMHRGPVLYWIWLMSDGTACNQLAQPGSWKQEGNMLTVTWSMGGSDEYELSPDTRSITSTVNETTGKLLGTFESGAKQPPKIKKP